MAGSAKLKKELHEQRSQPGKDEASTARSKPSVTPGKDEATAARSKPSVTPGKEATSARSKSSVTRSLQFPPQPERAEEAMEIDGEEFEEELGKEIDKLGDEADGQDDEPEEPEEPEEPKKPEEPEEPEEPQELQLWRRMTMPMPTPRPTGAGG